MFGRSLALEAVIVEYETFHLDPHVTRPMDRAGVFRIKAIPKPTSTLRNRLE